MQRGTHLLVQHLTVDGRGGAGHDRGEDPLAPLVVGYADDARQRDVGVGHEHVFDLGGSDVLSAPA